MRPDFLGGTSGRTGVSSMADDGATSQYGSDVGMVSGGGVKTFLRESGGALMK